MSAKPTPHLELVEPLQSFLETFTQELTEQKFIPAFRDELGRLLASLQSLQDSEASLQQIARGVDKLREVFAPAGTRLLESVKDLETVMRSNADQIKERADGVLTDLLETHSQLENALRNEAGLIQNQASASREALSRTIAEVEGRISGLNSHVDNLCRRLETETVTVYSSASPAPESTPVEVQPVAFTGPVTVEIPDELRELIARSEHTLVQELERYRQEIATTLKQGRSDDSDRLTKLDHKISESLSTVGPRVQEELETAVGRLRDQIQTLILAEVETRSAKPASNGEATVAATTAELTSAVTASETRVLREISALHKSQKGEQSEAERVLRELAKGLEEASERFASRAMEDGQAVRDNLLSMQRIVTGLKDGEQKSRDQLNLVQAGIDSLVKSQRDQRQYVEEEFHTTLGRLDSQARTLEQKTDEDRQLLAQLSAAMARAEQAATSATELALSDSRVQREKVESGIKDLRERLERGLTESSTRDQETLRRIAEAWTEALETLRDFVQKTIVSRTDSIIGRIENFETRLAEAGQAGGNLQRDLQGEIKRAATVFDERIDNLKSSSENFTAAMESHVKAVSTEVSALRAKQDQSLAVLKEAIRANYDDNAARLKEVIENAYDSFIKQTASVPQALDRYSHLIQSLYQGDQLALQAIASDTHNVVNLATEKFEVIISDNQAMKKFFPLLDKKLEKQNTELEMARKAQVRQDKEVCELKTSISQNMEQRDQQAIELRADLMRMNAQTNERLEATRTDLTDLKANMAALTDESLPVFRRELSTLLTSKFEFIEHSLHERQEAQQKDVESRMDEDRATNKKNSTVLAVLVAISILLQLFLLFGKHGAAH